MKKNHLIIVAFFCFALCSCNSSKNTDVKVGVILPLTGDLAFIGDFVKNSLLLENDSVSYIIEDCGGDPKNAINAVNKLINTDKVKMVISSLSFISEPINPICERNGVTHFILSFTPKLNDNKNVIRPFVSTENESNEIVNYILNDSIIKKVAFLRHMEPDAQYGFDNFIKPTLINNNISIIDLPFSNQNTRDFKNEILKIRNEKPDLIVIQALAFRIPQIISTIRDYSYNVRILGDINFLDIHDSTTIRQINDIPFVGVKYVVGNQYLKYTKEYEKKYNKPPFALGAFATDLNRLLYKSNMENYNSTKKCDYIKYLNSYGIPSITSGTVAFDDKGNINLEYGVLKYINEIIVEN